MDQSPSIFDGISFEKTWAIRGLSCRKVLGSSLNFHEFLPLRYLGFFCFFGYTFFVFGFYLSTSFSISLSFCLSRPVPCAICSNVNPILYKLMASSVFASSFNTSAIVILSDSSNRLGVLKAKLHISTPFRKFFLNTFFQLFFFDVFCRS